jgi:hypothetical protein
MKNPLGVPTEIKLTGYEDEKVGKKENRKEKEKEAAKVGRERFERRTNLAS